MKESIKASYQLNSIILKDSIFNRKDYLNPPEDIKIDLSVQGRNREKFIESIVTVVLDNKESSNDFLIEVTMIGIFEKERELDFPDEEFLGINAPAIVYPFIRQHIRSLTLEAGMPPIILPTVNFHANYHSKAEKTQKK